MSDFGKVKVDQIRQALVLVGKDEETVNAIKGKADLTYEAIEAGLTADQILHPETITVEPEIEADFEGIELEDEVVETRESTEEEVEKEPEYGSIGWNDYVMSQFQSNELIDGAPTVVGLRRVAQELLGEIVFSAPVGMQVKHFEQPEFLPQASCTYQITIAWSKDVPLYVDLDNFEFPERTFGAVAGSCLSNTDRTFAIFPEAMAETRAEVRALRKALLLRTAAYEELSNEPSYDSIPMTVDDDNASISDIQLKAIPAKCDQLKVDLDKLIQHTLEVEVPLDKLTKGQGKKLMNVINRYQTSTEDSLDIPEEIKKVVE